jgi:histidine ammonia-lyase
VLSTPACVDSIPTSMNKEDHVSMGATSARKLLDVVDNVETVLAIELMIAVEACEQRLPLRPAQPLRKVIRRVRAAVPPLIGDRVLASDIAAGKSLIRGRTLLRDVPVT